jgi:polyisoprenoid-binding protein YceI
LQPAKRQLFTLAILVAILALTFIAAYANNPVATTASAAGPEAASPQIIVTVDPAHSDLHWSMDSTLHTVHGTFAIARGEFSVDPETGKASGEIVADAKSGQTGNDSRDQKMHQEILETQKFPEIIFRVTKIEGLAPLSPKNEIKLTGTFILHGAPHEMTLPAQVTWTGTNWKGTANFAVPFLAWGIKNPGNFLLKVSPTADVELALSGTMRSAN